MKKKILAILLTLSLISGMALPGTMAVEADAGSDVLSVETGSNASDETAYTGTLICELDEHSHSEDECYTLSEEPTCGLKQTHVHDDDSCYEMQGQEDEETGEMIQVKVLICEEEEIIPHVHGDGCYAAGELTCAVALSEGHTHGEGCYLTATELTCGLSEDENHTHGDDCYTTTSSLACTEIESEAHTHEAACYSDSTLTCDREEIPEHTHSADCYEMALTCEKTEHRHTAECYQAEDTCTCGAEGLFHTSDCPLYEEPVTAAVYAEKDGVYSLLDTHGSATPLDMSAYNGKTVYILANTQPQNLYFTASGLVNTGVTYSVSESEYALLTSGDDKFTNHTALLTVAENAPAGTEFTLSAEGLIFTSYTVNVKVLDKLDDGDKDPECCCGAEGDTHQKGCPLYVASVPPLPSFPSCDCTGGSLAGHEEECAYVDYMVNQYFSTVSARDIYAHWSSFDESTRAEVLDILEATDPNGFQQLQAILDGKANEVAAIVNGLTVEAVGAIPEGITMTVKSMDASAYGFSSAVFAYDISFVDEDGEEWQPDQGTVQVTLDAAGLGITNGTYVQVYHLADSGSSEAVGRYLVSGGKMTFEGSSFSGYVGLSDGALNTSVSTTDAPITINLFDYGSLVVDSNTRTELARGMGGSAANFFDYVTSGTTTASVVGKVLTTSETNSTDGVYNGINRGSMGMYPVLMDGYPARESSGSSNTISLQYLFDQELEAATSLPYQQTTKTVGSATYSNYDVLRYPVTNGSLFTLDEDGYFTFDSADNHVWYSTENGGTLHKESYAVNPSYTGTDSRYSGIGHFLPFQGPITQYTLTGESADAYVMKSEGEWVDDEYQSDAHPQANYTVDNGNFVNTQADTLYGIVKKSTNSAQNRINMWIGMSIEFDFSQPADGKKNGEDMIFEFSGDDAMWVYIDDVMILDLNETGVHDRKKTDGTTTAGVGGRKTATINFSTGEVIVYKVDSSELDIATVQKDENGFYTEDETFNYHVAYHTTLKKLYEAAKDGGYIDDIPEFEGETFADFETMNFKMFYMDTGHGCSNCSLTFNMEPLPAGSLSVSKVEENLNDSFCGETVYEFELWKQGQDETTFSKVTNATFTISGNGTAADNDTDDAGTYIIGNDGVFKLKGGQTATFITGITVTDTLYVKEISTGSYTTTNTLGGTAKDDAQTNEFTIDDPTKVYSVVFKNTWNTADLTISKNVIGSVGDVSFSLTLKYGDSKTFDITLKNGERTTIEDLPVGYSFSLRETDPSSGAFRYQTPKYNDTEVAFTDQYSITIAEGSNSVTVTNRCLTDLKIVKKLTAPAEEAQSFLFHIEKLNMDVVLVVKKGDTEATAVIKDVVADTYKVAEDPDWSWRYEIDTTVDGNALEQTVALTSVESNNQVTFTNKRNNPYWLDGNSWCENLFKDSGIVKKEPEDADGTD